MGHGYATNLPLELFTQRNFVADRLYSIEIDVYSKVKNAF